MDVALAIFNIGAGLGVLAAGGALVYLAWRMTPLVRDGRALASDLRRLARTTEQELRPILAHARQVTSNVEVLSEDAAVKLDRLTDLLDGLQGSLASARPADPPGRPEPLPVESWETREDASQT
ncbi:MAG TPA: DUF948 domain-containing protein [Candidatus Binatia bacterium]|nr:DUF948 domain-containing protein [Candidatus Binatia bacterium]